MPEWGKLYELDTVLSADSVEWCPIEPYQLYFVCGTYFLLSDENESEDGRKNVQKRSGSLLLLKVTESNLEVVSRVDTYGILDSKWHNFKVSDNIVLATANTIGEVYIFKLSDDKLEVMSKLNIKTDEEGDYMTLSVKWFNDGCDTYEGKLCTSDNRGSGAVLRFVGDELLIVTKWQAHSLEAWTAAFDSTADYILYSGGDDAKLRVWDLRTSPVTKEAEARRQDTGVTIIETETPNPNQIVSGSFDESILFWDKRQWKSPLHQIKTSGGPWRAKFLENSLLTANIYGGFQVFDCIGEPKLLGEYKEHKSLAYGADWCRLTSSNVCDMFSGSSSVKLIGTCSFYDHKLTVSLLDPVQ